ncbi:MAG: hypothetical protein FWF99_00060 [Desulfovibrionaceae bacterium]|nr:hypothetical protein [Desulfovibrionaceae bacterium]
MRDNIMREMTVEIGGRVYDLVGTPHTLPAGVVRAVQMAQEEKNPMGTLYFAFRAMEWALGPEAYQEALPDLDAMIMDDYMRLAADAVRRCIPDAV